MCKVQWQGHTESHACSVEYGGEMISQLNDEVSVNICATSCSTGIEYKNAIYKMLSQHKSFSVLRNAMFYGLECSLSSIGWFICK